MSGQEPSCRLPASPMSSASTPYCTNTSVPRLLYTPSTVDSRELAVTCKYGKLKDSRVAAQLTSAGLISS